MFPIAQLGRALRYVAQARHLGKVVLSFEGARGARIAPLQSAADEAAEEAEAQQLEARAAAAGADAATALARLPADERRAALRELTARRSPSCCASRRPSARASTGSARSPSSVSIR